MKTFIWCFGVLLSLLCGSASAGYAQVQPPPGFSGNATTGWFYKAAANESWIGNTVRTTGSLNVGGQAVRMPAYMRMAANAGRFSAGLAFGNPWVIGAAVVGTALYDYYSAHGIVAKDGVWKHPVQVPGSGQVYCFDGNVSHQCDANKMVAAHMAWPMDYQGFGFVIEDLGGLDVRVLFGSWWAPATAYMQAAPAETQYEVLTRTGMETLLGSDPLPSEVPRTWPDPQPVQWPVEAPILNPSPALEPQPLRVPTGDPQAIPLPNPNPNNDPQRWRQPVTDIVPSPTPDNPWRVDEQPKEIILDSPTPLNPSTPPVANDPATPATEPPLTDCDKLPNSIGCSPWGDPPTPDTLTKKTLDIVVTPVSFSSGSGCPNPVSVAAFGKSYSISYAPVCDKLAVLRYIILAMAAFAAAWILADSFKVT